MKTEYILDADKPLSRSLLWQIQRRYFMENGMAAWQDDVVPHQISSSPYMARAYADMALAYVEEMADTLDFSKPFVIIELGAGSGRLAYHFMRQFFPRLAASPFAKLDVKLILTDFVPEIVQFWQMHPRFQKYIVAGRLDFALFDVMDRRPLHPLNSPHPITPNNGNPIILIANYFFDSIPQDSFVLQNGQLHSNLLTLYSDQPEPDLADPALWERLRLAYEPIPQSPPYYDDPLYDEILQLYEAYLPDTAVSFPNIGLDCLRFWQGTGELLLLSSDRGHSSAEELVGQGDPLPNLHGSFSLMVNYDAIARYVEMAGGTALHVPHYQDGLQTAVYLLGDHSETAVIHRAFDRAVAQNTPDDFFAVKQAITPHLDSFTLPQLLSFIRLSQWDGAVFEECFPALLAQLQEADPVWYGDVIDVVTAVHENYLPLTDTDPLEQKISTIRAICVQVWKLQSPSL